MEKRYQHQALEEKIYNNWEQQGFFTPKPSSSASRTKPQTFSIIMPPPNANDSLHIGHARFITIQDILIRYHRMRGCSTLWLPGADHAGIETQFVFEKQLQKAGKSRFDFDRKTLYKLIWNHVQASKKSMEKQLRVLGASCDWTRNKFTLDPEIVKIVYKTFKKLYDDGLIYRGLRLVNYCTKCGTGFSNLEVNFVERKHPLYYMKYGPFTLATVRPETKFGDTAVAVHPDDKRYKKWVGKVIEVKGLIGKFKVKVIVDKAIDPEFGTGVAKVTPAHDHTDFEIGQRHNLKVKQVIGFDGKLNEKAGKYAGLPVKKARKIIAADLAKAGLMVKIDNEYTHRVGVCYRCGTPIEPLPRKQWFVKVKPLLGKVKKAIHKGETKFVAKRYEKVFMHWLSILHDWNISRQIVWGIRIPAWKCSNCNEWIITDGEKPNKCSKCNTHSLKQDADTFDTWFSSGQWPYATLKTTKPGDFEYFYPTSVMETGFDILAIWVMRMMMLGLYVTGKVPFREVLIHGLVRDKHGAKISKSKGNVIDPVAMTDKYGADALRMSLVWGALIENDISLSEDNVRGQRNFANKLWNIGRYIEIQNSKFNLQNNKAMKQWSNKLINSATLKPEDRQILAELAKLVKTTTANLDSFQLAQAAADIYHFIWHQFADNYLEYTKQYLVPANSNGKQYPLQLVILNDVYSTCLRLLHPLMPFVTEAIWENLYPQERPLIIAPWPQF